MKRLALGFGVAAVVLAGAASARAQAPAFSPAAPGAAAAPRAYVRRPVTEADQLIFERALTQARERDARLEWRRWTGQSPSRPAVRYGHYSADLNQLAWPPAYGYYTGPAIFVP